jgi:hypothetical protein
MIQTRRAQRTFGDGLIAEEVKDLHEEWMKHADRVLGDKEIVAAIYEALAKRHPQSRTRGRPGTPAEVVLRLLVLKHMRNWSYGVLEREVRANLVYRDFTRVGGTKMPDAKTMGRWASQWARWWSNRSMNGSCRSRATIGWRKAGGCASTPRWSRPTFTTPPTAACWATGCGC